MARRGGDVDVVGRIVAALEAYPFGVHRIGKPARAFDTALPEAVQAVLRAMDGAELFHESIVLLPSAGLRKIGDRWRVGEQDGDDIFVRDGDGRVLRDEQQTGETLYEGTRFDRWLWGAIDAEAVMWDERGEARDNIFDESGELLPAAAAERERKVLRRDRKAPAPRWRLARALLALGEIAKARSELEEVVARWPDFGWALFDLARISESLGDVGNAREEATAAGEVETDAARGAMFFAHAARLAASIGDEAGRAALAKRSLARDPGFARAQLDGARAELAAGNHEAAASLVRLCLALSPRDVEALALRGQLGE